jgi:cyclic 2,3-diphosphoglycerate synthetase
VKALAVVDGEHYAPVVRDALATLPYEFVAAWSAGGTEKLRGDEDYGVPLAGDLEQALATYEPEIVVDLSDEPVLGPRERFRVASRALARGIAYAGPDFRFDPPPLAPCERASLAVVGTGKRVGKTALTGHAARLLSARWKLVVVAMGRGGPAEPELIRRPPAVERLLALSRAGRHAASDHLEHAALVGVVTVGCRRAGGGLAGTPALSNVLAGVELALAQDPELLLIEGSGASLPPVASTRRVLVASAEQGPELVAGYLNAYRVLVSDLVVVTMAENSAALSDVRRAIAEVRADVPVVAAVLRPRPVEHIAGRRVAFFTTAPPAVHGLLAAHLREVYGARVVHVSGNLARREDLRSELEHLPDAELYLTEIKAAAIDVVAEAAASRGIPVVPADNEVLSLGGGAALEVELEALAEAALASEPRLTRVGHTRSSAVRPPLPAGTGSA